MAAVLRENPALTEEQVKKVIRSYLDGWRSDTDTMNNERIETLQRNLPKAFFTIEVPELRVVVHVDLNKTVVFDPDHKLWNIENRVLLNLLQHHFSDALAGPPLINLPLGSAPR